MNEHEGLKMRMLVSVKTVEEALLAAAHGADFIDLKDPSRGALGGLPVATIGAIVAALRDAGSTLPTSATIGDWSLDALPAILAQVDAVGACGVDYVKVGIERVAVATAVMSAAHPATALLDTLATTRWHVVPVFIGDTGLDTIAVRHACALRRFPALMVDTADKRAGSLFDVVSADALRGFVADVRAAGALAGLAGALRLADLPQLAALAPDFAGFRSAVCAGDRAGALDAERLRGLAKALLEVRQVDAPSTAC